MFILFSVGMENLEQNYNDFFLNVSRYDFQYLGCWKTKDLQYFPTLEGNKKVTHIIDGSYRKRSNKVEKCFRAALYLGYDTFAVEDAGECTISNNAANSFPRHCSEGSEGGRLDYKVYKIKYGESIKTI